MRRWWRAWREPAPWPEFASRLQRYPDQVTWLRERARRADEVAWQERVERDALARSRQEPVPFRCSVDGQATAFTTAPEAGAAWREGLACEHCHLNARLRFALSLLREAAPGRAAARVYLTEQASHAWVAARRLFGDLRGGEFVQDPVRRGHVEDWVRDLAGDPALALAHEDPLALPHAAGSFDALGSFERLHRFPDPGAALREYARVLRPGGVLVLSAPFFAAHAETTVRARLVDGAIEHVLPAAHEEENASGLPVLIWRTFGWDVLDLARGNGFARAQIATIFAPDLGFYGDNKLLLAHRA